jgi:SAM-dependent methyltransferase
LSLPSGRFDAGCHTKSGSGRPLKFSDGRPVRDEEEIEQMYVAKEDTRTLAAEDRAFYDSHPYPAPIDNLDRYRDLFRSPDRRRAQSLLLWPTEKPRANREILVAGCGTSQAAGYALREHDAHVTAIDISKTCQRHTRLHRRAPPLT